MDIRTLTILRYTIDYEPMVAFYGDVLGLAVVESWDRADGRGSVFAAGGAVANATIEVLELAGVCVPGVAPVNVVVGPPLVRRRRPRWAAHLDHRGARHMTQRWRRCHTSHAVRVSEVWKQGCLTPHSPPPPH